MYACRYVEAKSEEDPPSPSHQLIHPPIHHLPSTRMPAYPTDNPHTDGHIHKRPRTHPHIDANTQIRITLHPTGGIIITFATL